MTSVVYENRKNYNPMIIAHPGPVGPVGDPIKYQRLRQSTSQMPVRFSPYFGFKDGANIQDGSVTNHSGGHARVVFDGWQGRRGRKMRVGIKMEDKSVPNREIQPYIESIGNYTWRTKVAKVIKGVVGGKTFLPGGYEPKPNSLPRGGNVPQVVFQAGGNTGVVNPGGVSSYPVPSLH